MASNNKPVWLRLPDDLYEYVRKRAKDSMRPMGAQIAVWVKERKEDEENVLQEVHTLHREGKLPQ